MTGRADALSGQVPSHYGLRAIVGSQSPAGGLNPSAHRTVLLRRRGFRRSGVLTAEGLVAGHRTHAVPRRSPRAALAGRSGEFEASFVFVEG
jgi:hypothetical protein